MKEKSKMAAKNRRENENAEFAELSKLLPLPEPITNQLDKASIIRLTTSYLCMRSVFPEGLGDQWGCLPQSHKNSCELRLQETASSHLQTMDGFILVVSSNGKIMYISETASTHLGLSQVELTGNSITENVHDEDKEEIRKILESTDTAVHRRERDKIRGMKLSVNHHDNNFEFEVPVSFFVRMKCVLPKRSSGLTYNGYKVIHCTGYIKVRHYSMDTSPMNTDMKNIGLVAMGTSVPASNPATTPTEIKLYSSMCMFRTSLDLKFIVVDPKFKELTGYDPQEVVEKTIYQHIHQDDVDSMSESHKTLLRKGQVTTKYYRFLTRHGGFIWMQSYSTIVINTKTTSRQQVVSFNYIVSERQMPGVTFSLNQVCPSLAYDSSVSTRGTDSSLLPHSTPTLLNSQAEQMAIGREESSRSEQSCSPSLCRPPLKRRRGMQEVPHIPLLQRHGYCVVDPMAEGSEQLSPSPPPLTEHLSLTTATGQSSQSEEQQQFLQEEQLHLHHHHHGHESLTTETTTTSIPYPVIQQQHQEAAQGVSPPPPSLHHHLFLSESPLHAHHPCIPVVELIPHHHQHHLPMTQDWSSPLHVSTDASSEGCIYVYGHQVWHN